MSNKIDVAWIEEMHSNPVTNIMTAYNIGLNVPEIKHFNNIPIEEENLIRDSMDWIVLEELGFAIKDVHGIHLTLRAYWTGKSFILKTIFLNDRALHVNGKGPQVFANCVTCFKNRADICVKEFKKLGNIIYEKSPEFEGFINIDVVYTDNKFYYHGIRVGLFVDFLYALSMLYNVGPSVLLDPIENDIVPHVNFSTTLRLYNYYFDPDYTIELIGSCKASAYIRILDDGAIVVGSGENIKKAWNNLYNNIPDDIKNNGEICYRNDGDIFSRDCFYRMRKDRIF